MVYTIKAVGSSLKTMVDLNTNEVHVVGTADQNQSRQLLVVELQQAIQIQKVRTYFLPELLGHRLSQILTNTPVQLLKTNLQASTHEKQKNIAKVPHKSHGHGVPFDKEHHPGAVFKNRE